VAAIEIRLIASDEARNAPVILSEAGEGAGRRPECTDGLELLTSPAAVLAEVRRVVGLLPAAGGGGEDVLVELPDETRAALHADFLRIGVREDTLALARAWVKSPDPAVQWRGAEVLLHDRSAAGTAALREFAGRMPREQVGRYGMDAVGRVYGALMNRRVTPLPPLVPAARWFDDRWVSDGLSLAVVLAVPAAYGVWRARRGRVRIAAVLWCLGLGVLLAVWGRSYWPQDAVMWGDWDVAVERGTVHVIRQWRVVAGLPNRWTYCRPESLLQMEFGPVSVFGWRSEPSMLMNLFDGPGERRMSYGPPGSFGLGMDWRLGPYGGKVSLWLVVVVWMMPAAAAVWGWRAWVRWRARRAKGFPVEV
jgi:hypothetical protein